MFADLGSDVSMSCLSIGNPLKDNLFSWRMKKKRRKVNTTMDTKEKLDMKTTGHEKNSLFVGVANSRFFVETSKGKSILKISDVAEEDEGDFICSAFNGIGDPGERIIKLHMKRKPNILSWMSSTELGAKEGDDVTFKCTAEGVPRLHFKWFDFNGDELLVAVNTIEFNTFSAKKDSNSFNFNLIENSVDSENLKQYRYTIENADSNDEHIYTSLFTVKHVVESDFGDIFECRAFNEMGSSGHRMRLRRKGKPDPPSGLTIVNITHNSAILNFTIGFDGGFPTKYQIKFCKVGSSDYELSPETDQSEILVKGLEPGSEYSFAVHSKNLIGDSNESPPVRKTTLAADINTSGGSALIDMINSMGTNNNQNSSQGKSLTKSGFSKILMLIVIVLGLVLVSANCALIVIYFRHKKSQLYEDNKTCDKQPKTVNLNQEDCNHISFSTDRQKVCANGSIINHNLQCNRFNDDEDPSCETIIMVKACDHDVPSDEGGGFQMMTTSLIDMNNQQGKRCKVLSVHEDDDQLDYGSWPQKAVIFESQMDGCNYHETTFCKEPHIGYVQICPDVLLNEKEVIKILNSWNYRFNKTF